MKIDFVKTPLRTVINLVYYDEAGDCIHIRNAGELWI